MGVESNPGPTNGDTLEWLKSLSGEKYSESNLEAAKTFLGFVGDRKITKCTTSVKVYDKNLTED